MDTSKQLPNKLKIRAEKAESEANHFRHLLKHIPEGMNHYCPGELGVGEWSHLITGMNTVCGYCKEPMQS